MKVAVQKLLVIGGFFTFWQILSGCGWWNPEFLLPSPTTILKALLDLLANGSLLKDILSSLHRVLVGFLIATIIGLICGTIFGYSKLARIILGSLLEFIRPIPPIAWISLAIFWFGIGNNPAYFLVTLGAFFPILSNVYFGINSVEEIHKRAALSLGAKKRHYIIDILIPSALPSIFTGLKTGLGISWMMTIVAELVGAQSGLGYMIQLNRLILQTPKVMAGMVIIGLIGFTMNSLMTIIEKRFILWRPN